MAVQTGDSLRVCALRGCRDTWQKTPALRRKEYCGDKHRAKAHAIRELDKEREEIVKWLYCLDIASPAAAWVKRRIGLGAGEFMGVVPYEGQDSTDKE